MRLVVDANILVAELIRARGRELIAHPAWELYMADPAWEEACHELNKRIAAMVQKGVFSQQVGQNLWADALSLAETRVSLISDQIYASYNTIALARIPRDPDDRPSVRQKSLIQKSKVQKRYKPLNLFMENEKYVFREECNQVILRPYYKPRPPRIANGASRFIYGVLTFDF